ncbi:MAG: glutamate-1-semialdehyde 2,1-aminomutase [Verrucomicrobiota bacterium]|jgi:glutamate-1-semialdehyde 2,1-aminomutase|nr:glutamate-1-semialdehyde 2,1-aminomutase [Verrucomicrobiota bacterium]MDP7051512.1 glutamate-1-semialdehyde 2,1-aminomutase [Verrucomicrobiota bacterium]
MRLSAKSQALFDKALQWIPGGVNSPVRAFRAVGGGPFFAERASGATVWDADGNEYIDYVGTWGPAILGHAPKVVVESVQKAAEHGTSFGIPNPLEVRMAELVVNAVPSVEKVRMCNSGTEATMSAIRLARGFTKRAKIIKFEGCYHGHVDSLLVKAGSGALTLGQPDSAGVPPEFTSQTIGLPFNDEEAVRAAFARHGSDIAGIILEPVPANAGLYLPRDGYLEFLRIITAEHGSLLIFDEVMTGFRLGLDGAQGRFGITPDLSCFGKVIGGGLPVGAFGGSREIMDCLAPDGPVYQAGTLSGNPLAMAAGVAVLEALVDGSVYGKIDALGQALSNGLGEAAKAAGVAVQLQRIGSMSCCYFADEPIHNMAEAMRSDRERFGKYFHGMLNEGVNLAPSQFEAGFISAAHDEAAIEKTVVAAAKVMKTL